VTLLLICETPIIEQIFALVSKKLNLELTIKDNTDIKENFDLIVVDQEFIDDKFNIIKQYSKRLGAISSEELPFDKSRDFIIPRPFLPTKLQDLLKEEIEDLKEQEEKQLQEERQKFLNNNNTIVEDEYYEDDEVTVPVTDYVESLADDVFHNIEDENDESIVSLASLKEGGVLDGLELSKINQILKEEEIQNEVMDTEDWKDINDIIDDALEEVKEYEFNLDNGQGKSEILPYKLVLSDYNIEELKPLLEKFNQEIVDKLSSGESVDIRLVLKDNI